MTPSTTALRALADAVSSNQSERGCKRADCVQWGDLHAIIADALSAPPRTAPAGEPCADTIISRERTLVCNLPKGHGGAHISGLHAWPAAASAGLSDERMPDSARVWLDKACEQWVSAQFVRAYIQSLTLRATEQAAAVERLTERVAYLQKPKDEPSALRADLATAREDAGKAAAHFDRYKVALSRANGFLIGFGHEPVKLEYPCHVCGLTDDARCGKCDRMDCPYRASAT